MPQTIVIATKYTFTVVETYTQEEYEAKYRYCEAQYVKIEPQVWGTTIEETIRTVEFHLRNTINTVTTIPYPNIPLSDLQTTLADLKAKLSIPEELATALQGRFICPEAISSQPGPLQPDVTQEFRDGDKIGCKQDILETFEVRPVLEALLVYHRELYLQLLASAPSIEAKKTLLDFSNLELEGADFTGIDLTLANFAGADISGAVFTAAQRKHLKSCLDQTKKPEDYDGLKPSWLKRTPNGSGSFCFFPRKKLECIAADLRANAIKISKKGQVLAKTKEFRVRYTFTTHETVSAAAFDKKLQHILKSQLVSQEALSNFDFCVRLGTAQDAQSADDTLMEEFSLMTELSVAETTVVSKHDTAKMKYTSQADFDKKCAALLKDALQSSPANFDKLLQYLKDYAVSITISINNNDSTREIMLSPLEHFIRTTHTIPYQAHHKLPENCRRDIPNGQVSQLEIILQNIETAISQKDSKSLCRLLKSEFINPEIINAYVECEAYPYKMKFTRGNSKTGKKQNFIEIHEVRPMLEMLLICHRERFLTFLALAQDDRESQQALLDFSGLELCGADFTGIDLQLANFANADFTGAIFTAEQRKHLKHTAAHVSWIHKDDAGASIAFQREESTETAEIPKILQQRY